MTHRTGDVGLPAVATDPHKVEGPACGREVRLLLRVQEEARRALASLMPLARFPRGDVRPELGPVELVAGVEEEDVHALPGEVPGGHAARSSAADHHHRMHPGRLDDLHGSNLAAAGRLMQDTGGGQTPGSASGHAEGLAFPDAHPDLESADVCRLVAP